MNSSDSAQHRPQPISLGQAFWYWLKLGFISFGGPAGQIAIMHQDLVEKKRWISERRYLHALNYCMLLPGPEAQQLATYLGWLMHRTWGGIIAGGLFVLPSVFILIGLGWIYLAFGQVPAVAGVFYGIKPAVTAIVLFAACRIGSRALKNWVLWIMAALAFLAIFAFDAPFPLIVLAAALLGALGGKLAPQKFAIGGGHGAARQSFGPALIDDDTPTPAHARFTWPGLFKVILAGLILWGGVTGLLCARFGWNGALTQMGWFFTKAALLTFGGAYAVLPYVYQGAVEHYQWLTPHQMIDGLALGETTPGPLIMVVTFVGFVAGWAQELFGPDHLFLAGAIAATVVTYFTFLPSFLFILAGGPLVESTHGNLKFTAPLTGITAAVVGVILNLAVFFAYHVFWPQGLAGRSFLLLLGALLSGLAAAEEGKSPPAGPDIAKIERLTGVKGKLDPAENVFKVSAPRSDLKVTVAGVHLIPPLGLTSWAAFAKAGSATQVTGDLVLLEDQVSPVMDAALSGGLEVTGLHNHFLWDTPRVMFMHIAGLGDEDKLATAVGRVFAKIGETAGGKGRIPKASIDPKNTTLDPVSIEAILGVKGELANGVYKVTIGRSTTLGGHPIGNAMGVNTWAAFAGSNERAVVDGDFVMSEEELQPVVKALRKADIHVVAIHQHMMGETPKMMFLHYWGVGRTADLARGLKLALETQKL